MGRNESEPHRMSLENARSGDKPSDCRNREGRRAQDGKPSASAPNSGGVSVGGTSGSATSEGWEVCGGGAKRQPPAQVGVTGEADWAAAEVGILHSSVDLWALDAQMREELHEWAQREDTCQHARKRSKGGGMAREGYEPH